MKTVNVRFGGDVANRSFDDNATVGQVVNDPGIRAELGFGDSIRVMQNGVEQCNSAVAPSGGMLVVETRANSKATA